MRKYTLYLLGINLLFILLLLWMGWERTRDFQSYHLAIAKESTASASLSIENFISEKKRLVKLFANENRNLILAHAKDSENEALLIQLNQRIAKYFPDYFTFTVSDDKGEPFDIDFDGYIGDLCRRDLKNFVKEGVQSPRIHPNNTAYHFDILAPLNYQNNSLIMFISFHADVMGQVLKNSETRGHKLLLIDHESSDLIEVTSDGARINWDRDNYRMTDEEKDRILFSRDVAGTVWQAVDLYTPDLFVDFNKKLFWPSLFQFLLVLLLSLLMLFLVRREEALRIEAEQKKENFLAVVSHDLRTPITSISGSLELIQHGHTGAISESTKTYVDIAVNNSKRLINLINDLLDLQKFEAGEMTFEEKDELLSLIIENSINANQTYMQMFDATCRLIIEDEDLWVHVDAARMDQAFSNLLSNAVKYGASKDEIIVTISRFNNAARVSITDHGKGIPAANQDQVFKRYAQISKAKSRHVSSTGLGLNIVKNIIEQQGGKVGFVSDEDKGSTCYIDLPLIKI